MAEPNLRAREAEAGSLKNNQICAPLPERERSTITGILFRSHTDRIAETSSCQFSSSKSIARNRHVSSGSIG
ncbi:MAG: hypothetical protein FWE57_03070 [Chitinispirillia bacterium]|nr:hypothetical protein [Chitinispirillia bacterium]